jgi:hypothetical protein
MIGQEANHPSPKALAQEDRGGASHAFGRGGIVHGLGLVVLGLQQPLGCELHRIRHERRMDIGGPERIIELAQRPRPAAPAENGYIANIDTVDQAA